MRGRKRKPSSLHVLHGTDRPDRMNWEEPNPASPDSFPDPPDFLDEVAKEEWSRMGKELFDTGLFTSIDSTALAAYCVAYSQWTENIRKVTKFGTVFKTPNGYPAQSPYLSMANKAFEQMTKMLIEFGMTPSARARVKTAISAREPPDEVERFLNGR